ncbi:uncharacterized protein M421DRAFT_92844 [Didymella exigua CBS 183.55]|uniref:Uncharacterized protein n=1 Tax=Didymella exigua CBS 183.55 TaxID=1150837 RepID=A0A6A5RKP0_9PLEO|nr:uncharacterized protein M421DRAFT_92844 [Didymella exigua CBS 183.55]KAF1928023.1 hypothetical protein M421DRAFT_92844 [Didymella exigua CBS 183.55]
MYATALCHLGDSFTVTMRSSPCEAHFPFTQTFQQHNQICSTRTASHSRSIMNALDFLFDFADLMSTSSAMKLPPGTNKYAQDTQASKALSTTAVPSQSSQYQGEVQQPSQQLGAGIDSILVPQSENDMATFSRTHVESAIQHPIDWVLSPQFMQQPYMQEHSLLFPEHLRLPSSEDLSFGFDITYLHHHDQSCHCTHMPPPSMRFQHGCMIPSGWNVQQPHLEHLEPELHHLLPLPTEGLTYGNNCEHHVPGQLFACEYYPPHSYWAEDGCVPVAPRSIDVQYGDSGVEMSSENGAGFMQHY